MIPLTKHTMDRLMKVFDAELHEEAERILAHEVADNLYSCENKTPEEMERVRFAVIKMSEGVIERMKEWIEITKSDWNTLFVAAGFHEDYHAYKKWKP